jgi:phosphoribosyl 1,2-cyclic phosphate phosphodiesterase
LHNKITVWGTGDSLGVPRVYCNCTVCDEARTTGINNRWRSSILLETKHNNENYELCIDCGPDWQRQMELLHKKELDHVLITHAHFDHIAGLPHWADACRWQNKTGHVYAPLEVLNSIQNAFSWLHTHQGFNFGGWFIEPWKVNHGKNGYSYAYRFHKEELKWVYCPDSIHLQGEQKARLFDLELLILGTSYYKELFDIETRSVYDMTEALQLIAETSPKRVCFTHMSHGIDAALPYSLPLNVQLARTGMVLNLW